MKVKLTLTLEKRIIESAKEYAKEHGQSLSEIVENYFKLIVSDRQKIQSKILSPRVRKLKGTIKTKDPIDYKKVLAEELSKK